MSGELTFTLGFGWNSSSGKVNKCEKPKFKPEVKVEVTFFVGFDLKPELTVLSEHVASASMSGVIGAEVEAIRTTDKEENHSCTVCTDGNIQGKLEIKLELTIAKTTPIGGEWEATLIKLTIKIADFYYSETNDKFGWGECPYKGNGSGGSGESGGETGGSDEVIAPPGYIFAGYDENGNPIFVADDVEYTVEIYKMNPDGEYGVPETMMTFYAYPDAPVSYVPMVPEGYWVNTEKSVLKATVRGDGSTVLSVYLDCITGNEDVGDLIEFGTYPQTKVTNENIINALNSSKGEWVSYGYYSGTGNIDDGKMYANHFMRYMDVTYRSEKYRGVVFDSYRPYWTGKGTMILPEYTYQAENGYYNNTIYWFKYEPIKWRVLDPNIGLLMSEIILDSQAYNNFVLLNGTDEYGNPAYWADSSQTHYANSYANSSIRKWLNNDFYNTAFSTEQQNFIEYTELDNTAYSDSYAAFDSETTNDKVFLLSWNDVINANYGFSSSYNTYDTKRCAKGSDYAKCQGVWVSANGSYSGNSYWRLRTPSDTSDNTTVVGSDGYIDSVCSTYGTCSAVRPALRLNLNSASASSSLETQSVSTSLENGVDTLGFSYDKFIAGNTYTLLNVTDYGEGFELSSDNLYYINTVSADENGKVIASFIPKANAENSVILLVGDFGNGTETVVIGDWYNEYTVTWNTDGETVTQTVIEGAEIIAPENPEKVGYTFTGWTPSIPATMPDYDLTFTATWKVNSYEAVFNANSGAWADGATAMTVSTEYGAKIIAPEIPEKQGYIFSKWSPEIGVMDSVDGKKFTAEWIPATDTRYTVETYTMNTAGEYEKTVQTLGGTTGETVSTNPEIKTGFALNPEKSVLSGTVAADNSLILKVFIDRNTYTFATVIDGVSAETKYYYGSIISDPVPPTREGYKFIGWDTEIPSTMPAENVTVTAMFEKIPEAVVVKIPAPSTTTINYGDSIWLHANIEGELLAGAKIIWTPSNNNFEVVEVSADGLSCKITPKSSGTTTFTVSVVDADEKVLATDTQDMTAKAGLWQKIVAFFKKLFGATKTYPELYKSLF